MSLLWTVAVEQASQPSHISHDELADMYSGDYDVKMKHVLPEMQRDWDESGGSPTFARAMTIKHGGPRGYINHLKKDIARNGMKEPLTIRGGNVVTEGHHRGVVAMELKMDKIPVRHIR